MGGKAALVLIQHFQGLGPMMFGFVVQEIGWCALPSYDASDAD